MHPVVHSFELFTIRSYGLALVLSFVAGIWLARARAEKVGVDPHRIADLCLLILVTAVVGSRLLHVAENVAFYTADPWRVLRLWEGGMSMYGGLFLALVASFLYTAAIGVPFATVADVCAPSLALGESLTRIGCFLNGCCFGTLSTLPWAMTFPRASPAGHVFPDAAIHPTQLYTAVFSLLILGTLLLAEQRRLRPGGLIGLFLVLQAAGRFAVELVRHHDASVATFAMAGVTFTSYQLMSLGLFVLGTYLLLASTVSEGSHEHYAH